MPDLNRYQRNIEYYRQYRAKNREHRKEVCRKWHRHHKKEDREYLRNWRKINRDKVLEGSRRQFKRYKENGTYPIKCRYRALVHSAKRIGIELGITLDEFTKLIVNSKCHYCHMTLKFQTGHSLDRKDNTQGYSVNNVVPCCGNCNRVKNEVLTYEEMCVAMKAVMTLRGEPQLHSYL